MIIRRRRSGFQTVGNVRLDRGILPTRRARELRLAHAWSRVVGPALARRAVPVKLSRGTLDVEVLAPERGWDRTLTELLPTLAGRLAAELPELRIRRCRLNVAGDSRLLLTAAVIPPDEGSVPAATRGPSATLSERAPENAASGVTPQRLRRTMERYLARATGLSGPRGPT